jgi:2'-hydroxyisoflavone reductase
VLGDDSYGGRKAACERVVLDRYGDRALIARPGLIVGPHDPTDRFSYWPRRFRRPGPILAPGEKSDPAQFIDARDLAAFLLGDATGIVNVVREPLPMAGLLDVCRAVAGTDPEVVWVPAGTLIKAGIDPWMGVPLWIGDPDWSAANLVDSSRARAAGLTIRPLEETVAEVTWDETREEPLSPERERELLRAV